MDAPHAGNKGGSHTAAAAGSEIGASGTGGSMAVTQATSGVSSGNGLEFPFTGADFQTIAGIVYERSGIVLSAHKRGMAYSSLARRLRALGLRSFKDYCAILENRKGESEIVYLINAITANLTKFFRVQHHFEHLRHRVLPQFGRSARGEKPQMKVWSAGCSSGEEPYSIAMGHTIYRKISP
ncbi:MAG: CheR family methyltransferase [Rhodomicrobium sp.]